jgi:peroxiredoxin
MSRYRDNAGKFTEANSEVFGVSVDSTWANMAFREKLGVPFVILSDFKKDVVKLYGILDERTGYAYRTTFVIDSAGVVQHIDQAREALDPSGAIGACALMKRIGE